VPSDTVQKAVFGRSGNRCACPDCVELLVVDGGDTTTIIGELAHIVAKSVQGPRGHLDIDPNDREHPGNYVALCPSHHTLVDKNPLIYSVPVLRAMKEAHEKPFRDPDDSPPPLGKVTEKVHSSMLWVSALPSRVFSAPCTAAFEQVLSKLTGTSDLTPFVLRDGRLWTFHDLSDDGGPEV
jgi:hypothetical protein